MSLLPLNTHGSLFSLQLQAQLYVHFLSFLPCPSKSLCMSLLVSVGGCSEVTNKQETQPTKDFKSTFNAAHFLMSS